MNEQFNQQSNKQVSDKASKPAVHYLQVSADRANQRIDNYLTRYLKGVPKSRIYRLLRKGEVRVNKKTDQT